MADPLWYPSVDDVLAIHDDIVSEYPDTPSGVQDSGDIEFALNYIEEGSYGRVPNNIHEKAFHLLRLLVANHPFVDANKRTALNTTVEYLRNHTGELNLPGEIEEWRNDLIQTDSAYLRLQAEVKR